MDMIDLFPRDIVDDAAVRQRFGGAIDIWEQAVLRFTKENTYATLREAVRQRNVDRMEREAHTLKGLAGMLGFDGLYTASMQMVTDCRAKRTEALDSDWIALESAYRALTDTIADCAARRHA